MPPLDYKTFEGFEEFVLNEYNATLKEPVDKYDTFFKSYLIGRMSMMIPQEQFDIQTRKRGE